VLFFSAPLDYKIPCLPLTVPNATDNLALIETEGVCNLESFRYRCTAGGDNVFEHDPYHSEVVYQCNDDGSLPPVEIKPCTATATCK
jgi:hypothetical protein